MQASPSFAKSDRWDRLQAHHKGLFENGELKFGESTIVGGDW